MFGGVLRSIAALLLPISILGYGLAVYQRFKLKIEFIPVFVFSCVILLMFFAGLWNIMPLVIWFILLGGTALFGVAVYKAIISRKFPIARRDIYLPGILVIAGLGIIYALNFRDARLMGGDSYNHWIIIIKDMLLNDRLPNFMSPIIWFPTYPPGSALFIYFGAEILGNADGMLLFIQMVLILSCTLCLFAFCDSSNCADDKKVKNIKRIAVTIMMALATVYFLNGPSYGPPSTFDILVDNLALLFGLTGIAIVMYYRDDIIKAAIISGPVMCATILIKNPGVFYVLLQIAYLLLLYCKANKRKPSVKNSRPNIKRAAASEETATAGHDRGHESKRKEFAVSRRRLATVLCIVIAAPFICMFLWQKHVDLVFPDSSDTFHAISIESYSDKYNAKSEDDLANITQSFINKSFDFKNNTLSRRVLIWNAVVIALYVVAKITKQNEPKLIYSLLFADIAWVLYLCGVLLVYIFSMSNVEALGLNAYDRYALSGLRYFEGYLLIQLALFIHRANNYSRASIRSIGAVLCMSAFVVSSWQGIKEAFTKPIYEGSDLHQVETAITVVEPQASYAIYAYRDQEGSLGYLPYVIARYTLWTPRVTHLNSVSTPETMLDTIGYHDFLVVVQEDEYIRELLQSLGVVKNDYTGTYYVRELLGM